MTASQQLGGQVKEARLAAHLTLRELGAKAEIPWTSIAGYEKGKRIPADKFLRIADALNQYAFKVDGHRFNISRLGEERLRPDRGKEQLKLDFSGEYDYSKASVRISPGKIEVALFGVNSSLLKKKVVGRA